MSDYISTTLQDGSEAVALAARPSSPPVIRARGDRRRRRNKAGIAVAAVAVVAVGAGSYPLARDLSAAPAAAGGAGSTVPKVAGETLLTAERAIRQAGLSVGRVTRQRSEAIPAGLVIRTLPRYGAAEPEGARVGIVVSAGGGAITVPDLVGMTDRAALQLLQQLQLRVAVQFARSRTTRPDTVIRELPAAGSLVSRGSTIVLYVAPARAGA